MDLKQDKHKLIIWKHIIIKTADNHTQGVKMKMTAEISIEIMNVYSE